MIPLYAKQFYYQIPWKSSNIHAGDHRGTQRGLGFEFKGNVSLVDYPDARRMDLRQTIRDPYEQVQVKLFNQDNTTPIFALCDVSSSMQFRGKSRKLDLAKEISASIAYSAYENNDDFSFIAYDQQVIESLTIGRSHHIQQSFEVIERLSEYNKMQVSSEGVLEATQYLSQQKGLVFWVSDFHTSTMLIEQAMNAMSLHHVVPIVLWDDYEYKKLPKFGFGNMIDPETGQSRTLFFREALRKQLQKAFEARKELLEALFTKFDTQALFLSDRFEPELMSAYFEQVMG